MIQLFRGSIFNSKCDLIIIPCDNMGRISQEFRKELMRNSLSYVRRNVFTGDVLFVQNTVNFFNASVIGYAASVDVNTCSSKDDILKTIMQKIKNYCIDQSLQKVNIPLLGTGNGGLSATSSYNIMKKEFEHDSEILLCVYALKEDMYKELFDETRIMHSGGVRNPRVFISYASVDIENRAWVKKFACRLRKCGINARLDMFHLKPGQDLPQWMTNELIMADKVLLICDKYYAEKADNRKGGVGWETMIIQGDMLSRLDQNKYIAILRDADIDQSLPIYVKSRYALNWADKDGDEKEFNELLLYLFDCDIEPPLGDIPAFIKEKLTYCPI